MLTLRNISFRYHQDDVLKNINLSIPQGSHISVIGASGCGKSTLLKLIYGLYTPSQGTIHYNGKQLLGPEYNIVPGESFMKYLAQDFDLMPFTTAKENVGKFLSNFYPDRKESRSIELLEAVEMAQFSSVKVKHLSGGQQQRVALARSLANEPEILLLDEPFSHIDNFQKNSLRRKLFSYLKEKNITCVVATHDSTDALSYADNTIVLQQGSVVAENKPEVLYNTPPNTYTASLFGEVNILSSKYFFQDDSPYEICIYPHELVIKDDGILEVLINTSYFHGSFWLIEARLNGKNIYFVHDNSLKKGIQLRLQPLADVLNKRRKS